MFARFTLVRKRTYLLAGSVFRLPPVYLQVGATCHLLTAFHFNNIPVLSG
jgi:hypothetical protein